MNEDLVKEAASVMLVVLMATMAVALWWVNLITSQRAFGAFLASELLAFSILCYLYSKPSLQQVKLEWVAVGLLTLMGFLVAGLYVAA